MENYDSIIIGTGQSGPSLAARLATSGQKVAIIEKDKFGGTCVNTGCTPTKTLVASARTAHVVRRAADYGIMIHDDFRVDMKKVKARKDRIVQDSTSGVEKWLKSTENLRVFEAHARFVDKKVIQVGDKTIGADKIFINTGTRPYVPEGVGSVNYMTNEDMMNVDFVPEHLIIVGGSYIGLEFGQMFRRFGSEVTIIEMGDRIVRREDEEVSQTLMEILQGEGIRFRLQAECINAHMDGENIVVDLECESNEKTETGTHLLMATGRMPNTDDLGLEHTEVEMDKRGYIHVNDRLESSVPGIYVMGDANGEGAFTHTSYNDYEIVAANLLDNDQRKVTDRIPCYALYTDPPLARIGMSVSEVKKAGISALRGFRPMSRIARAKEKGETQGFIEILVEKSTKKILGATILGINGDEIIHSLLDVMYANAPYTIISRAVHIHPTVSELLPTILQDLQPLE
jgi:pyruvate/2-oxoglutarate dehydrogenase complex dihydrolipoamide dehydrogenase (E3) component